MSAWVCSELHINTLATFLAAREIEVKWRGNTFKCIEQPANVANILMSENVASVNYRYGENDMPSIAYALVTPLPELIPLHKAFGCYDYQACEHPEYEQSLAKRLCDAGLHHIETRLGKTKEEVEKMAEWDNAPWGIN
jgi:hypothetical protein